MAAVRCVFCAGQPTFTQHERSVSYNNATAARNSGKCRVTYWYARPCAPVGSDDCDHRISRRGKYHLPIEVVTQLCTYVDTSFFSGDVVRGVYHHGRAGACSERDIQRIACPLQWTQDQACLRTQGPKRIARGAKRYSFPGILKQD